MKNLLGLILATALIISGCASQPSAADKAIAQYKQQQADSQAKASQEALEIDSVLQPYYANYEKNIDKVRALGPTLTGITLDKSETPASVSGLHLTNVDIVYGDTFKATEPYSVFMFRSKDFAAIYQKLKNNESYIKALMRLYAPAVEKNGVDNAIAVVIEAPSLKKALFIADDVILK